MFDMALGNARVLSSADVRALDRVSVKALLPDLRKEARALRTAGLGAILLFVLPFPVSDSRVLTEAKMFLASVFLEVPEGAGWLRGSFAPASGRVVTPEEVTARKQAARTLEERALAPGDLASLKVLSGEADQAVADLSAATKIDPRNPNLWSDLSAALLLRAERKDAPDSFDRIRALQAADRAVALCHFHREASVNLALALQALFLDRPAVEIWDRLLVGGLPHDWRRFAEDKRKVAAARLVVDHDGDLESDLVEALLHSLASPGEGEAKLQALEERARTFARERGDSFSLAVLLQARAELPIAAAGERAAWKRALSSYDNGLTGISAGKQIEAGPSFATATRALARLGSPLRWRAEVEWAMAEIYQEHGSGPAGVAALAKASGRLQSLRSNLPESYLGLKARTFWGEALAQGKAAHWSRAMADLREAEKIYGHLGDVRNLAAIVSLRAEALSLVGRDREAWADRVTAFQLANIPGSEKWMHNALMNGQEAATKLGWSSLSDRFRAIALVDARNRRDSVHAVEALVAQAQELMKRRRATEANAALDEAEFKWLAKPSVDSMSRSLLDVSSARADLEVLIRPEVALRKLAASIVALRKAGIPAELVSALDRASRASEELKDRPRAVAYADEAMREVLRQAQGLALQSDRQALFEKFRPTFDRLVLWLWEGGERRQAFGWILAAFESERTGKLVADPAEFGVTWRLDPAAGEALVIPYALTDRVLVWAALPSTRMVFEAPITERDRPAFASLSWREVRDRSGNLEDLLDPEELRTLSTALLGPIGVELETVRRLVFVPSVKLRALPFAALFRPGSSLHLVEGGDGQTRDGIEVSVAVPAGGRSGGRQRSLGGHSSGLFVGNPRNAEADRRGLEELSGASKEVLAAIDLFPFSKPALLGSNARKSSVIARLPEVDFAHFAVHTVPQPTGRALLLASSSEGDLLLGAEVARLKLRRPELVSLAACRTTDPGSSTFGGEGLVEPFLEAGARAVIASPRAVSDSLSPELWGPFYRELRAGRSPAAALRSAQLECLHSPEKHCANPAFWAGFAIYHGDLPMKGE